jgi:hypothetical protein
MFLWFYVWWYAGALIANFVGVSPALGPIMGAAAAALFVGDPRRIIWSTRNAMGTSTNPNQEPI